MQVLQILIMIAWFVFGVNHAQAASWVKPVQPPSTSTLTSLAVSEANIIYVSSEKVIYQNQPSWDFIWQIPSSSARIVAIKTFSHLPDSLYILTDDGLYQGHQKTASLSRIFYGSHKKENRVLSFAIHPDISNFWLLGTESGLFQTTDNGTTWTNVSGIRKEPVSLIQFLESSVLIGVGSWLYRTEDLESFQVVFRLSPDLIEPVVVDEELLENDSISFFSSTKSKGRVWIATKRGVLESHNDGLTLHWLPESGLRSPFVQDIVYDENHNRLFAATNRGVYVYEFDREHFRELYQGMSADKTTDLELFTGPEAQLLAVTSHGVMSFSLSEETPEDASIRVPLAASRMLYQLLSREPSAREIHEEVVRYNDVSNQKIKRWHHASRLKALVPTFSFGRDYSEDNNIDLDRGSTSVPDTYISGPNDINESWDFDVSWDLGDSLYSSAQTSIDSRSKLMADFRHELLSEATRLFYERRRLQVDIVFSISALDEDHLNKLIRMEELTSLLDAMTGGYLSRKLEEIYAERPELMTLWMKL